MKLTVVALFSMILSGIAGQAHAVPRCFNYSEAVTHLDSAGRWACVGRFESTAGNGVGHPVAFVETATGKRIPTSACDPTILAKAAGLKSVPELVALESWPEDKSEFARLYIAQGGDMVLSRSGVTATIPKEAMSDIDIVGGLFRWRRTNKNPSEIFEICLPTRIVSESPPAVTEDEPRYVWAWLAGGRVVLAIDGVAEQCDAAAPVLIHSVAAMKARKCDGPCCPGRASKTSP